jgi:hypothetical protein
VFAATGAMATAKAPTAATILLDFMEDLPCKSD